MFSLLPLSMIKLHTVQLDCFLPMFFLLVLSDQLHHVISLNLDFSRGFLGFFIDVHSFLGDSAVDLCFFLGFLGLCFGDFTVLM